MEDKKSAWNMAIGLSNVDGLTPSNYLLKLINNDINGDIRSDEIESIIVNHYMTRTNIKLVTSEFECDLVAARIINMDSDFVLSPDFLVKIHKYLFNNIYNHAGRIRVDNLYKKEDILMGESVLYAPYEKIIAYLKYDFNEEKKYVLSNKSINQKIYHIADFTSRIWQVHAFYEGNTRSVAIFMQKYLKKLGFSINNDVFAKYSSYFRGALVRANSYEYDLSYLVAFYENLLLGYDNHLDVNELVIKSNVKKR